MTEINVFIDEANHIYLPRPIYNIIEYSDNYSDNSGSFSQFKRDEVPPDNANNNFTADNSWLLKCKAAFVEKNIKCHW